MEAGHAPDRSDYKIARAIFLADITEEAVRRARSNTVAANFEDIGTLLKRGGRGVGMFKRDPDMRDPDAPLSGPTVRDQKRATPETASPFFIVKFKLTACCSLHLLRRLDGVFLLKTLPVFLFPPVDGLA